MLKHFVLVLLVAFSSLCLYQPGIKEGDAPQALSGYIEAAVSDLQVELTRGVITLGSTELNTTLDIYISREQGENIYAAIHNISAPRPLSHDLFLELLKQSGMEVSYVSVDRLEDGVYYATTVITRNGAAITLDARPSDSIVLALKAGVPIYVHRELMMKKGEDRTVPGGGLRGTEV